MKIIRTIKPQDNAALAKIIIAVLEEHGFKDAQSGGYDKDNLPPKMKDLYSYIYRMRGEYYVVEDTDSQRILGGGGFISNDRTINGLFSIAGNQSKKACELEKFYFLPEIRGTGLAMELFNQIQHQASLRGYPSIYIETEPSLARAIQFYKKSGFKLLETKTSDAVYMIKFLSQAATNPELNDNKVPLILN